jgi:hypothetical protein
MSLFSQTLILYLVVGGGVAGAVYLSNGGAVGIERWLHVALGWVFWPLFLPVLLRGKQQAEPVESFPSPNTAPRDDLHAAIDLVDAELKAALGSLDGWAEDVLAREKGRLHELRTAWAAQAERIREMDRLLSVPESAGADEAIPALSLPGPSATAATADRLRSSRVARQQNIERLRRIRQRTYEDLIGTLAWVRELVSMIHLAKFTGAPASRAEELVAQIAASVEGLSELTWQEELPVVGELERRQFAR